MRVLITGAGGFIGSHLVDKCKADGHYVIGLDKKLLLEDWVIGCDNADCYMTGVDVVDLGSKECEFDLCYHLAAESRIQPSFKCPVKCVKSNVLGTAAVLQAAVDNSAGVVYAGSSTADDIAEKNVYAMSKWQGEELCRTWRRCFGITVDIARFYNVYGVRHLREGIYATVVGIFEKQLEEGNKLTVTGTGQQRRDFTAVEDIVDGLVAIAEKGNNGEYRLGTGINCSVLDVARMFVNDDQIEFIPRPPGESENTIANVQCTKDIIGWEAKKWLKNYVRDYKKQYQGTL